MEHKSITGCDDSACCPRWQMRVEEVAEGESQQSRDVREGGGRGGSEGVEL